MIVVAASTTDTSSMKGAGSVEDHGSTLVEAVVGIALLGIILVGVIDASWTNTRVAALTRQREFSHAVLVDALAVLHATAFSTCPHLDKSYETSLSADSSSVSGDPRVEISSYEYWDEASKSWLDLAHRTSQECTTSAALASDFAVQRMGVSVLVGGNVMTSSMVVKTRAPEI